MLELGPNRVWRSALKLIQLCQDAAVAKIVAGVVLGNVRMVSVERDLCFGVVGQLQQRRVKVNDGGVATRLLPFLQPSVLF